MRRERRDRKEGPTVRDFVYGKTVGLHGRPPSAKSRAPSRPLAPREQAAIMAWAGRASTLTPARLDELAELAQSVTASAQRPAAGDATRRLLGVAQWLLGHRGGGSA